MNSQNLRKLKTKISRAIAAADAIPDFRRRKMGFEEAEALRKIYSEIEAARESLDRALEYTEEALRGAG